MEQLGIVIFGVTAVWLTQQRRVEWRRYACLFGMAGQPFWFYAAWKAGQPGIAAIVAVYTYLWGLGIYNNWIKRPE